MKARNVRDGAPVSFRWRAALLTGVLTLSALGLVWRAINLQLVDHGFLARQGDARFLRQRVVAQGGLGPAGALGCLGQRHVDFDEAIGGEPYCRFG